MVLNIIHANNSKYLPTLPDGYFNLIYIDPPFNTGRKQARGEKEYKDSFGNNFEEFIVPKIEQAHRLLSDSGSLFIHLDWHEAHYVKVWTDKIFGRDNFMNEIIWAYDYGGRSKSKWSSKHDNIFWYVKDKKNYTFHFDEMDRIPYMAPGLVGKEKAVRGKTPNTVWWHTIVPTNGKEKTGYPTQKPLGILERIIKVHSSPGDFTLDFFGGSGSFGHAAYLHDRHCVLIDRNQQAIDIMKKRFEAFETIFVEAF